MGGAPLGAVIALSIPATLNVALIEALHYVIQELTTAYDCLVIDGNVSKVPSQKLRDTAYALGGRLMAFFDNESMIFRARFYYALRFYLHKKRWLLRLAQVLRASIVLGPLRKPIVRYYQKFSHNDPLRTDTHPLFPHVDTDQLVNRINEVGYAHVGELPEEYITQILDYCAINKQTRYWNPHENCEAVDRICRNEKIVDISRKYLGAEPILWLTLLKWS